MNTQQKPSPQQNAVQALESPDPSVRLRAAMEMGKHPDPEHLDALVGRCAVEPDFYVRDMLTWAITRLPSHSTLPRLRRELESETAQARSQALHTLSKIGDRSAWPWVSRMLHDPDCEVARTAWRSAAALVPDDARRALAVELAGQLGRGDRSLQRSLSRSLIELGPVLDEVLAPGAPGRRRPSTPGPRCSCGTIPRSASTPLSTTRASWSPWIPIPLPPMDRRAECGSARSRAAAG